jgi:hypothetical protein
MPSRVRDPHFSSAAATVPYRVFSRASISSFVFLTVLTSMMGAVAALRIQEVASLIGPRENCLLAPSFPWGPSLAMYPFRAQHGIEWNDDSLHSWAWSRFSSCGVCIDMLRRCCIRRTFSVLEVHLELSFLTICCCGRLGIVLRGRWNLLQGLGLKRPFMHQTLAVDCGGNRPLLFNRQIP